MSVEKINTALPASYPEWFRRFLDGADKFPGTVDGEELTRRREIVRQLDELRSAMSHKYGVQPDSTPMIRAMRDHE